MLEYRIKMEKIMKIPNVIKTFGNSMHPLLLDGDILYLKKIKFSKIRVNDIITVKEGNHYFTHRVIYKDTQHLVTKGDNNAVTDSKVYPKNIVGIVQNVKRDKDIFNPDQLYLLQSSMYFGEIVKIKNILEENNIKYVFLKGLPLHLYLEKTHPKRFFSDCDILINPKDFPKVKKFLKKSGYLKVKNIFPNERKVKKNKESEISYAKNLNGLYVVFDIHFEIVFLMTKIGELDLLYPQKQVDLLTKEFMTEKRTIKILGENFQILSENYLILYLCLHLFHHNFRGAYRYDFIDKIIKNSTPDYKIITEVIKKYNLQNFAYPCFIMLKKYYKTPIDRSMLHEIKPNKRLLHYIKNNIFNIDIFNEEERLGSGTRRFKMIFFLSPYPIYRKALVFFNKEVLYSVFWVFYNKLKFFKGS